MAGAKPYSEEQIIAMFSSRALLYYNAAPRRNRALFAVALTCGVRVSELVTIRIGDALDQYGHFREDLRVWQIKQRNYRCVPIANPIYFRFLTPWIEELREAGFCLADDYLFPGNCGGHLAERTVNRIYRQAHQELQLSGYSSHSTRKSWAVQIYSRITAANRENRIAVDPFEKLCELGGWQSYDAARRYIADSVDCRREIQQEIYGDVVRFFARCPKMNEL